jgi:transcription termination factor NusB
MSKRTERRAAEREARKLAYQQLRQSHLEGGQPASEQLPSFPELNETKAKPESTISEAQLSANRANAKLSTGAVTPEGRAKSSMNALKTGLTGKTVLLPNEDPALYQETLNAALQTAQPATEEECALVRSLVDGNWRLDRIQRLESAILLKGHIEFAGKYEDRTPRERALLIDADAYLKYEKQLRNLNIQEARLRRLMDKDRAELSRLQAIRKREEKQASPAHPQPKDQNGFEFSTTPPSAKSSSSPHTRAAQNA